MPLMWIKVGEKEHGFHLLRWVLWRTTTRERVVWKDQAVSKNYSSYLRGGQLVIKVFINQIVYYLILIRMSTFPNSCVLDWAMNFKQRISINNNWFVVPHSTFLWYIPIKLCIHSLCDPREILNVGSYCTKFHSE